MITYKGDPCKVCNRDIRYEDNDDCQDCKPRGKAHRSLSKANSKKREVRHLVEEQQHKESEPYGN